MHNPILSRFADEMHSESGATRKLLQVVPLEKHDWKPHEKSFSLGRLATHIAEISGWVKQSLLEDELNFSAADFKPRIITTAGELLDLFEKNLNDSQQILRTTDDKRLDENWTMRNGEQIFFTQKKYDVLRTWCFNHQYHHRAQLGIYLRLLNVQVPGTYGPSADTRF